MRTTHRPLRAKAVRRQGRAGSEKGAAAVAMDCANRALRLPAL
jgi:hypothetical protein